MVFDSVVVSNITDASHLLTAGLTVHNIFVAEDSGIEKDTFDSIFKFTVDNYLNKTCGDMYCGEVAIIGELNGKKVGTHAIIKNGDNLDIYHIAEVTIAGWMINSKAHCPVKCGYFTRLNYNTDILSNKKAVENLNNQVNILTEKNLELQTTVEDLYTLNESRSIECKKLRADLDRARKDSDKDLAMMQKMNRELNDLHRKIIEKDREMASLRDDASYAVRAHATPVKTHSVINPAYDTAIELIRNFNKNTLLSKEARNAILNEKNKKITAPAKPAEDNVYPNPWCQINHLVNNC
jgi:hypothetical protein